MSTNPDLDSLRRDFLIFFENTLKTDEDNNLPNPFCGDPMLQINRKKAPDLSHGDELLSLEYRAQIPLYISTSYISIIEYNHFQLQIL
jgi:hypothetical protein